MREDVDASVCELDHSGIDVSADLEDCLVDGSFCSPVAVELGNGYVLAGIVGIELERAGSDGLCLAFLITGRDDAYSEVAKELAALFLELDDDL